jgi:hypothetical protein
MASLNIGSRAMAVRDYCRMHRLQLIIMELFDLVIMDMEKLKGDPRCYRLIAQQVGSAPRHSSLVTLMGLAHQERGT